MRALKRPSRSVRTQPALVEDEPGTTETPDATGSPTASDDHTDDWSTREVPDDQADFDDDVLEIFRVYCPECARPIALLAEEEVLPEHALCSTPWNPFGLTVCAGSGRPVAGARPVDDGESAAEQDVAVLLTLPAGLDWRTQPFSHMGGPGSRPMRVPRLSAATG
jgi:hypothetical protein